MSLTSMSAGKDRSRLTSPPSATAPPPSVQVCPSGEPSRWRSRGLVRWISCARIIQRISRSCRPTSKPGSFPPIRALPSEWAAPDLTFRRSRPGLHASAEIILPSQPSPTRKDSFRPAHRRRSQSSRVFSIWRPTASWENRPGTRSRRSTPLSPDCQSLTARETRSASGPFRRPPCCGRDRAGRT